MASVENKADQLVAEAEKKLAFSFFSIFFNKSSKIDHAVDCYQRAANLLKVAKNWFKAGDCFMKAGDLNLQNENQYDAAINYVNAANCYKKREPEKAITSLILAINIFTDMGRFCIAAKHHQTIAEIYEVQLIDINNSLQHYEQAADYFKSEDQSSSAEICILKIAHYSALYEDYQRAIEIYQQVALAHIGGVLLKYNVQIILFKAALCHICNDLLCGKTIIERYIELFPSFEDSLECKFVLEISEAIYADSMDAFSSTVEKYKSCYRSDEWIQIMILRIEKNLSDGIDLR